MAITEKSKWLTAVASGLLLTAAFPKIELSILAWVALVPLLVLLRGASSRQAFRLGMIAGMAHYLTLLYWVVFTMRIYGYLPWWQCVSLLVLLAAYLALYPALFACGLTILGRKPVYLLLLAPTIWVALEYVRSFFLTGFPWGLIGYSQVNRLTIIQIADLFGVYGVSFVVVLVNAAFYVLLLAVAGKHWSGHPVDRRGFLKALMLPLVVLSLVLFYGKTRIDAMQDAMAAALSPRVTLVQGNIDQARKWDPAFQIHTTQKYVAMTLAAAEDQPDLVVWPETATPFYFEASPKLTRLVTDAVSQAGVWVLLGSPTVEGDPDDPAFYNSAYLVAPDGRTSGRYDKVHLVPFGEYVPLKRILSFVGKMVAQVGDFSPGERGRTLAWQDGYPPIGVQICFEIIFPGLSRHMVNNGAGLLANLTNDAWFGRTAAAYQHFSMTVFRAVENRRSLVRCANTGISGFIAPTGRILASTALFEDAVVTQAVPLMTTTTLYSRVGDLLPWICLLILGVLTGRLMLRNKGRLA